MSFRQLLTQTRDTVLGAFAHQGINVDQVVRELNPDRRHGAERMTRVSFGFRGPDRFGFTPPGVRCERADLRSHLIRVAVHDSGCTSCGQRMSPAVSKRTPVPRHGYVCGQAPAGSRDWSLPMGS